MPESKTRFIPRPDERQHTTDRQDLPYYGTGLSNNVRLTNVGLLNPDLYSDQLTAICRSNEAQLKNTRLRVEADDVTSQLEEVKRLELEGCPDVDDTARTEASSRWQFRDTNMKYTGSLDQAKRDYFELEDIDSRSDMGPPVDPINGYCYLCTTQEEHRLHLKSLKKVHGAPRRPYNNPVRPESLPFRPFSGTSQQGARPNEKQAIYKVVVKTGSEHSCGTDAQVTLRIYGLSNKQKTPKMVLRKPGSKFIFMRDSTNTFSITAENFPDISAIELETDGYEKTQSWFLDSVRITNVKTSKSYYFPCSDWLSLYHQGETLVRKLVPEETEDLYREYEVTVVTGGHKHSGTDSKVYLTLVGSQGHRSKKCLLAQKISHCFRRGAVDTFPLTMKDVGTLAKIRIEHDNKGKSKRWLLLIVFVRDLYNGRQHIFYCNQWLVNEEGNAIWREIPASKVPKGFDLGSWGGHEEATGDVLYEVNVHTGDVGFAGTDASIMIQFYGDKQHSKSINLSQIKGNYDDPFEKNQTDIFQLKAADVGDMKRIKIGHDNRGVAAGWYLEKVLIRKFVDVKTRIPVDKTDQPRHPKKKTDQSRKPKHKTTSDDEDSSEDSSSESDSDDVNEPFVIGRNQTSSKPKNGKSKSEKKRDSEGSRSPTVTKNRRRVSDPAISDSDQEDSDPSDDLSDDSDDDLTGSAADLMSPRSRRNALEKRKKAKEKKRRRRMDNLSDVAEMSEVSSSSTSVWDSEEVPTTDSRIEEALRLKQEHDKLSQTMEKVVPMVQEYTFICKQWFAENEGDGKIERVLRVSDKKVYARR